MMPGIKTWHWRMRLKIVHKGHPCVIFTFFARPLSIENTHVGSLLGELTRKFWVTSDRNGTVRSVLEGNYLESHHAKLRQDCASETEQGV